MTDSKPTQDQLLGEDVTPGLICRVYGYKTPDGVTITRTEFRDNRTPKKNLEDVAKPPTLPVDGDEELLQQVDDLLTEAVTPAHGTERVVEFIKARDARIRRSWEVKQDEVLQYMIDQYGDKAVEMVSDAAHLMLTQIVDTNATDFEMTISGFQFKGKAYGDYRVSIKRIAAPAQEEGEDDRLHKS